MFKINDKVVCVDDSEWRSRDGSYPFYGHDLRAGEVYVVREVLGPGHRENLGAGIISTPLKGCGVRLTGVVAINKSAKTGILFEVAFQAKRFRKLSEIKAENAARAKQEAKQ